MNRSPPQGALLARPGACRRRSISACAAGPRCPCSFGERSFRGGADLLLLFFLLSRLGRGQDDVVDEPVLLRSLGGQEVVTLGVLRHLLHLLSCVTRKDLVQLLARAKDLLGVDLDVSRLALHSSPRLVDEDVRVRQRIALALRAAREQHRGHRVRHADADGRHRRPDVLHRVVDREARGDVAAGAVDVERDLLFGVLGLQEQQLRHHEVGDLVVDRSADEDDPVLQQPGVDVERALTPTGVLDDHRDEVGGGSLESAHVRHQSILDSTPRDSVKVGIQGFAGSRTPPTSARRSSTLRRRRRDSKYRRAVWLFLTSGMRPESSSSFTACSSIYRSTSSSEGSMRSRFANSSSTRSTLSRASASGRSSAAHCGTVLPTYSKYRSSRRPCRPRLRSIDASWVASSFSTSASGTSTCDESTSAFTSACSRAMRDMAFAASSRSLRIASRYASSVSCLPPLSCLASSSLSSGSTFSLIPRTVTRIVPSLAASFGSE